jgi:hypothetical protein
MKHTSVTTEAQGNLARALGLAEDAKTDVRTLLRDGGVTGRKAERIAGLFDRAAEISDANAKIQKGFRKGFNESGIEGIDESVARTRNVNTRKEQALRTQLNNEINGLAVKGNVKERIVQGFENVVSGRSANMLTSASVVEKNVLSDVLATLGYAVKNPIKMARSIAKHGNIVKNTFMAQSRGWKNTPKSITDAFKYITGNTFQTAMAGAQAAANLRSGAVRTQLAKWAHRELIGRDVSSAEAERLSRAFGNDIEALVNMATGVENGTINDLSYRRALKNWKEYVKSGSEVDYSKYLRSIDKQNSLASSIMRGIDSARLGRVVGGVVNGLLPFMRNATNMTVKAFTRDLNPMARSLVDEIRLDQMGAAQKVWSLLKNKTVDYGALVALSTMLEYNDGSEVDKPRGVSIKYGDGEYFSVRGTPIELPLALTLMTKRIAEDTMSGDKTEAPSYYLGMIKDSIPYVSQMEQNSGVVGSASDALNGNEDGDGGYAVKSSAVNLAKSLTPFTNNSLQPWIEGKKGNSLNAKSSYDKSLGKWYSNSVKQAFSPAFRDTLKDSRDAAGRVRTVDNQGAFINKTINDKNTATYNDAINNLVDYGRANKLGKNTQDMFNTFDTGKNNNFRSIQGAITFLGVPDGAMPDNADKLKSNKKLADLSHQIYDGFFGNTGNDLLTLDGQPLKSDASVPVKSGAKNSRLPMSMQAVKNAVAATDLPKADNDRMYEISQEISGLYGRRKAGEFSYDQEQVIKAKMEKEYTSILEGSKNYQKMQSLMNKLNGEGFFAPTGLGSTKSGQTYLWNSLNAMLGDKGATPAAQYPEDTKGFTPWGDGKRASNKPGDRGAMGIKWTPVKARAMANVKTKKYTPVDIKVKLGNAVKRDKTQNFSSRTF